MGSEIQNLEKKILALPIKERALLIKNVIQSLDENEEDSNVEELWEEEVEKRYELYKKGKITGRPIEEVLKDARTKLQ